jgi:tRNA dimethylallyltransferase
MKAATHKKTLLVISGPTASGKTALAIRLAKHLKTVIISADSRQFYREMSIGTAKPTAKELAEVKHYFINSHSITETFTVGDFEKQCLTILDVLFEQHTTVVMAGGSGLYIKAVCEGFDGLPVADAGIREALNFMYNPYGLVALREKLKVVDPEYYRTVDRNNPQRIIRALEVFETTGKPFSSYRLNIKIDRAFNVIKLGLNWPREILYERIDNRVDNMIEQGLIEEANGLFPYRHLNALNTVGYSELFAYMDGKTPLTFAISQIKQNTRRFAKRQLTWFRKDQQIIWLDADGDLKNNLIEITKSCWRR